MDLLLRAALGALAVPFFLVVMLLQVPAAAALAAEAPSLFMSVGLLVVTTCLLGVGIHLAGRAST